MKNYEIIIFDLDDTLIDNLENVKYAFTKMVEFVGKSYTDEDFLRWYHLDKQFWIDFHNGQIEVPLEYQKPQKLFVKYVRSLRYCMYFNNTISLETAFQINDIFLESLKEVVIPVPGAYETLSYLHNKYRLVIATNGPAQAANAKLRKIDCIKFIDAVFSADMTEATVTKPHPQYFEELKDFLQFYDTNKMLIVGDSLKSEILGGMNAHIDSCWFNPHNEPLPEGYNPTITIQHLKELVKKL